MKRYQTASPVAPASHGAFGSTYRRLAKLDDDEMAAVNTSLSASLGRGLSGRASCGL